MNLFWTGIDRQPCKRKSNNVLRFFIYRDIRNSGFVEKVAKGLGITIDELLK